MKSLMLFFLLTMVLLTACSGDLKSNLITPAASISITEPKKTPAPDDSLQTTVQSKSTPIETVKPSAHSDLPVGKNSGSLPSLPQIPVLSAQQGGSNPLKVLWRVEMSNQSTAEVIGEEGEMVFVKSGDGSIFAYNSGDGTLVWSQPITSELKAQTSTPTTEKISTSLPSAKTQTLAEPLRAPFSAVLNGTVIIGDREAKNLKGYDSKTGQKKWESSISFEAPNRDPQARFLPGGVFGEVLVVAVSTNIDPFASRASPYPEYLHIAGIDFNTGRKIWTFTSNPASPDSEFRLGNIIYGFHSLLVEDPGTATYSLDPKTGAVLWRAFGLSLINGTVPDTLYAQVVHPRGKSSNPVIYKLDLITGKPVWQRSVPVQINSDQPIAISPDEKTAYISVFSSPQKSFLWTYNFETEDLRQTDTSAYGLYNIVANNDGVVLVQSSRQASGVVFFGLGRDKPSWAVGGIVELVFGPAPSPVKDLEFLTFADETSTGYLFSINTKTGQIISTNRIEAPDAPLYFSPNRKIAYQIAGKSNPIIYAFNLP